LRFRPPAADECEDEESLPLSSVLLVLLSLPPRPSSSAELAVSEEEEEEEEDVAAFLCRLLRRLEALAR
jgi:hypothetical protein